MAQIEQAAWDALAMKPAWPFLQWAWLNQLEQSGCIVPEKGWNPCHLTVWQGETLVAAAPLYIKMHNQGEFVFDNAWYELAQKIGAAYYPKLVGMSPVTPVVGYRFLIAAGLDHSRITRLMVDEIVRFCRTNKLASFNMLFVDPDWRSGTFDMGMSAWYHQGFLWYNADLKSFDDYLAVFKTNQRRNIKRECKAMQTQGITLKSFAGDQIPDAFFERMYRYYARTNDRYGIWGCKYLNEAFFSGIGEHFKRHLMFVGAFEKGSAVTNPVGLSMFVTNSDRLYGRYWGCREDVNFLHFNTCFYKPIEWIVKNNFRYFDPGIGAAHKLRRGFRAVANMSLHRFFDPRMDRFFNHYIDEINDAEKKQIDLMNMHLPLAEER